MSRRGRKIKTTRTLALDLLMTSHQNAGDKKPQRTSEGDPLGFLLFLVLLAAFGGAILFAVRSILDLLQKGN